MTIYMSLMHGEQEFRVTRLGKWVKFPGHHGLIQCQVRQTARGKYAWVAIQWHAFGYWNGVMRGFGSEPEQERTLMRQKFNSEKEAKAALLTALTLYRA